MTGLSRLISSVPRALWAAALCGAITGAAFAVETGTATPASTIAPTATGVAAHATPPDGTVTAAAPAAKSGALAGLRLRGSKSAPPATDEPSESGGFGSSLTLIALLVAAGIALLFTRKKPGKSWPALKKKPRELTVRSSVRVGGKWHVALIDVPGSTLVVGSGERGLQLLTVLPSVDDDDADAVVTGATATDDGIAGDDGQFFGDLLKDLAMPAPERAASDARSTRGDAATTGGMRPIRPPAVDRMLTPSPAQAALLRQRLERYRDKARA